jgi:hypothetical protein
MFPRETARRLMDCVACRCASSGGPTLRQEDLDVASRCQRYGRRVTAESGFAALVAVLSTWLIDGCQDLRVQRFVCSTVGRPAPGTGVDGNTGIDELRRGVHL